MVYKNADGVTMLNHKRLEDCTRDELEAELKDWGDNMDQRLSSIMTFIEVQRANLIQENERLWKAVEGRK